MSDDTELQSTVARVMASEPEPGGLGDLHAENAVLRSRLAEAERERDALKETSLETLTSFDCSWGIGSGRHCPDGNPCMSHRFEKARSERDELRQALVKYGHHRNSCKAFPATSDEQIARDCDCGLQAALVARHDTVRGEGKS
jgi:hypothetical protein